MTHGTPALVLDRSQYLQNITPIMIKETISDDCKKLINNILN